jgi:hypothetical protein
MNVVCGNVFRHGLLGKTSGGGSLLFPVTIQKRRGRLFDTCCVMFATTAARIPHIGPAITW